ncbi:MAG: hypothetical protein HOO67_04125 [Candidatus Peribacteraceae bacterium]|nr:hypothetical protein [Candidatus Peribacteraceae bacterium]
MPNAPRSAPNTFDINLTRLVTDRLQRENPTMDRRAMAGMINSQKRQLAQQIHMELDAQEQRLLPVDRLERRLASIAQEMEASDRVHAEAPKEGWMSKIGSALTYPIREPGKTFSFLWKTVLVTAVVATIGAIVGSLMFGGMERLLQQVGLSRLFGARNAAQPGGNVWSGGAAQENPVNPAPMAGPGRALPGSEPAGSGSISPGDAEASWVSNLFRGRWRLGTTTPGTAVPGMNPFDTPSPAPAGGSGTPRILTAPPPTQNNLP